MNGASASIATIKGAESQTRPMDALKLLLSLGVYAAMIVLCILRPDVAGMAALGGGALGFAWRYIFTSGSAGERLGNAYGGSLMGLCLGYAIGGIAQLYM